jgi:hypothetical protein
MVAVVEGDVVIVGSLVVVVVIELERVVREVAVPERLRAADRVSFVEAVADFESEKEAVADPEGEPETVSATEDVAEAESFAERVSTAVPVAVRVVLILREAVPEAVGETVPTEVTDAVVEGEPDTVGTTVPEAVSVGATVPEADKLIVLVGVPVDERVPTEDFVASVEPVDVRLVDMVPVGERVPTADIDEEAVTEGDLVLVTE